MAFFDKKVSVWHIIYIVLICAIFCLFIVLMCPGKISEEAYTNFSFAATITSIVLAVVSIVYSLQSGLSSTGQLNSIKDIEVGIKSELAKFSDIEGAIKNVISPLEKSTGEIKDTMADIKKNIDAFSMSKSFQADGDRKERSTEGEVKNYQEYYPSMFYVILYMCQQSYEKRKEIPYFVFRKYFSEEKWHYCYGVLKCLSIFNDNLLKLTIKEFTKIEVLDYNESLGSYQFLQSEIAKIDKKVLELFDDYFND